MTSLLERQAPIDRDLANALIAATPETWNSAEMSVEREDEGTREKMNIVISSPDGHREAIVPTDEIYTGLYMLSDLYREHGKVWRRVSYSVALTAEGNWKFNARFEY